MRAAGHELTTLRDLFSGTVDNLGVPQCCDVDVCWCFAQAPFRILSAAMMRADAGASGSCMIATIVLSASSAYCSAFSAKAHFCSGLRTRAALNVVSPTPGGRPAPSRAPPLPGGAPAPTRAPPLRPGFPTIGLDFKENNARIQPKIRDEIFEDAATLGGMGFSAHFGQRDGGWFPVTQFRGRFFAVRAGIFESFRHRYAGGGSSFGFPRARQAPGITTALEWHLLPA